MTPKLSLERVRGLRLVAQLLADSAALPRTTAQGSAPGVAKHMLASQAQNRKAALEALDIRAGLPGQAREALDKSLLIRTWSQRGTHQILAAEDVRWMSRLCSSRVVASSERRQGNLGLTPESSARAREVLKQHAATAPVTRARAYELFASVGVDPGEGRGQHLLRRFGGEGDIVQGPPAGNQDTFVLLDMVCPLSLALEGDEALAEMTRRYFRSRGAATAKDLQWWTGLTLSEVKRGIALAEAAHEITPAQGPRQEQMWIPSYAGDITDAEITAALSRPLALPSFDEYLLAYTDRSHVMDVAHSTTIGPGKNGLFRAFQVIAGEALPLP